MCFDSGREGGGERLERSCNVCALTAVEKEVERDLDEVVTCVL